MDISFEILDHDGVIHIESVNEQFSPYTIDIDKFWGWVQKQGFNEYCNDIFDPTHPDNHRQETGTFTREEYFDLHYTILFHSLLSILYILLSISHYDITNILSFFSLTNYQ